MYRGQRSPRPGALTDRLARGHVWRGRDKRGRYGACPVVIATPRPGALTDRLARGHVWRGRDKRGRYGDCPVVVATRGLVH